jgi:hypothetical protein
MLAIQSFGKTSIMVFSSLVFIFIPTIINAI